MKKSQHLIALADRIESKYEEDKPQSYPTIKETPISEINDPNNKTLFELLNKTSHLAEKIAYQMMKLSDNITDYEMSPESFPKEKLIQMHKDLATILAKVETFNS